MKLDHVSLHILNMQAAVEFYTDAFELKEVPPKVKLDVRWFEFSNGTTLHLIPAAPNDRPKDWGDHFAMSSPDLDAAMQRLRDKKIPFGTRFDPTDGNLHTRPDGVRQLFLIDPDNNLVEMKDEEPR